MYYAKSKPLEPLDDHISKALEGFEMFMKFYGHLFTDKEKELIYLAVRYHDEGKKNEYFQNLMKKLSGKGYNKSFEKLKNIPHGYLSPAFIPEEDLPELKKDRKLLYNSIVFHHARDYGFSPTEIKEYIETCLETYVDQILNKKYIRYIVNNTENTKRFTDEEWIQYAIIKGILNKMDYWASSHSELPVEIIPKYPIIKQVSDYMGHNGMVKNDMQQFLETHNEQNTIIIASTGSGKTEGSLLWAKDSKVFYTLPLRVSINAMYQRVKDKYDFPEVSLLHSDALNFEINTNGLDYETSYEKYKIARNLSNPVTICTVDQILTFCYRYAGCELLFASLKYSKLIIDEIQAYSPDLMAKIIYSLKLIKEAGGKFLIMTATFPPVLRYFLEKENVFTKEDEENFGIFIKDTIRHKIIYKKEEFDYEKIKEDSQNKKVLVICNTVRKAQEVYEKLKSSNTWILHSRMMGKDRTEQEKRIFSFVDSKENGIWITTQVVEASIDVDFDVLYTEMCTADSLLQRLGRCYRKRTYTSEIPNIYIYDTENGLETVYDEVIYKRSVRFIKNYSGKYFTENEKIEYINQVYDDKDKEIKQSQYYKEIEKQLYRLKTYQCNDWTKEDAKKAFRDISTEKIIPKSIYNELLSDGTWDKLINQINGINKKDRILAETELSNHCISIHISNKLKNKIIHDYEDLNIKIIDLEYDFKDGYGPGLKYDSKEEEDNYL